MRHARILLLALLTVLTVSAAEFHIPWYRRPGTGTFEFGTDRNGNDIPDFYVVIQLTTTSQMATYGIVATASFSYQFNHSYRPYRTRLSSIDDGLICYIYGAYDPGQNGRPYIGNQPTYPPGDAFVANIWEDYLSYQLHQPGGADGTYVNAITFEAYLTTYVFRGGDPRDPNFPLPSDGDPGGGGSGTPGPIGPPGPEGPVGPAGPAGPAGPQGEAGPKGDPGDTGPQGVTGAAGLDGVSGINGAPGAPGTTGAAGATGATGATGEAGAQGIQGLKGDAGAPGAKGDPGTGGVGDLSGVESRLDALNTKLTPGPPSGGLTDPAGADVVTFEDSRPLAPITFVRPTAVSGLRSLKQAGTPSALNVSMAPVWADHMGTAPSYSFSFTDQPGPTNSLRTTVRASLLLLLYLGFLFGSYRLLLKAL